MTKIKICGITNYEDAKNSIDLGADFLGFNFYQKSPRHIDCRDAKGIIQKLDQKSKIVGVFVNESIANIKKIGEICSLDIIQLSGDESPQYVDKLKKSANKKIIKSFRTRNSINAESVNSFDSDYIMIDSFKEGVYGGTGESLDLGSINGIDSKKLFLAGGLNAENVRASIKKFNPFAVDVCSGIESGSGKKDYAKMKKFIEAVK